MYHYQEGVQGGMGAIPADRYSIRGSTSPWTDDAFVAKYEECKSEMKKEGNDIEKAKCPKMSAKN